MNLNELQCVIGMWSDAQFGHGRDGAGCVGHLKREYEEFLKAEQKLRGCSYLPQYAQAAVEEATDMIMLLLDWMRMLGYTNPEGHLLRKLEINMNRRWGEVQPDGSIEHVRDRDGVRP